MLAVSSRDDAIQHYIMMYWEQLSARGALIGKKWIAGQGNTMEIWKY